MQANKIAMTTGATVKAVAPHPTPWGVSKLPVCMCLVGESQRVATVSQHLCGQVPVVSLQVPDIYIVILVWLLD